MKRTPIAEILAKNLDAIMEKEDLTQGKVRDESNASQATVSRIRLGKASPSANTLEKIAEGLKLEPWQLMVEGFDPYDPPAVVRTSELQLFRQMLDLARNRQH